MLDFESIIQIPTPLQKLEEPLFAEMGVEVFVKRDDLTHAFISGNKFRKLKYNLLEAEKQGKNALLTFGGAYSNHLSAFAFACRAFGFRGKAVVRGEELNAGSSPTLAFLQAQGVEMEFVSREAYRDKEGILARLAGSSPVKAARDLNRKVEDYPASSGRIPTENDGLLNLETGIYPAGPVKILPGKEHLSAPFAPGYYLIPEGGSNALAVQGVAELIPEIGPFDCLVTACGTGGTLAGLISGAPESAGIIGVSVLKNGDFLKKEVAELLGRPFPENATLLTGYHFGGYARYNGELLEFMRTFESAHGILLEQVYTAKAFYAFYNLLKAGYFRRGARIVLLHTGGLQGRLGAI